MNSELLDALDRVSEKLQQLERVAMELAQVVKRRDTPRRLQLVFDRAVNSGEISINVDSFRRAMLEQYDRANQSEAADDADRLEFERDAAELSASPNVARRFAGAMVPPSSPGKKRR